jgi:hypothetical protein
MTQFLVAYCPIGKVIPYEKNARKIPQRAIDKVAASIKEFGWRQPIVVDKDYVIIVGHARLLAAKQLGILEVPVHVAENLTPAQVKAYRLMDNRSHEESDWDIDLLLPELRDLKAFNIDLSLTGFETRELNSFLLDTTSDEKANEVPDVPKVAVSQAGDLWICGPHRVICGDSTSPETVARLLGDRKPFLMVTDPPYGIELDSEWRDRAGLNGAPGHKRTPASKRRDVVFGIDCEDFHCVLSLRCIAHDHSSLC